MGKLDGRSELSRDWPSQVTAAETLVHDVHDVENGPFPFTALAQMEALLARGWVDAWRHLHPRGREFTWFSHRSRMFRLDHVFLSPACAPWLRGAWFDRAVRETGATDHSALIVDLQGLLIGVIAKPL